MKNILLGIIVCIGANFALAQSASMDWAVSMGGTSWDRGTSISLDPAGNVYTTGYFSGTVDFDPSPGVFNLTSNGNRDIYIQKLDANGNFIWAKSIGGTDNDIGRSLWVDNSNYIYLTGYYIGTVDFDPGAGVADLICSNFDGYVLKLDLNGNFIWVKSILGGSVSGSGIDIKVDATGNIYTMGSYDGTADFDPSGGVYNLTSNSSYDIYIQKLDPSGNFIWAKSFGGVENEEGTSIALDLSGNVLLTGIFRDTVDFDPGVGTFEISSYGEDDAYILKLDVNGDFVWAKSVGGSNWEYGRSIGLDGSGNAYITGYYSGQTDFDPGMATFNMTPVNSGDIFVLKLDVNGDFVWVKSIGGDASDHGYANYVDLAGNVYSTGYYEYFADFDPGVDSLILESVSWGRDVFIQKMDADGNLVWAKSVGGLGYDYGYSITANVAGDVYVTGSFEAVADFDPNAGVFELTPNGSSDAFILKLVNCVPEVATDAISTCDSLVWVDGNTYLTSNNTATFAYPSIGGCDSIVTLDLTINSNTGIDVQVSCNPYTWIDGNTYNSSNNTTTFTLTNLVGCDSVVTLDLTINSNTGVDAQIGCDSYTWIDGNTYSASNNTATFTLTNMAGCDSVITLDLTITPSPNNGITQNINNLSAIEVGATYQWLDCDNSFSPINGETAQSYAPPTTGNYAVQLTMNGCVDTSQCLLVDYTSLQNINNFGISIYPNPSSGIVYIQGMEQLVGFISVEVNSVSGELVWSTQDFKTKLNLSHLTKGIYMLNIKHQNGIATAMIMIE